MGILHKLSPSSNSRRLRVGRGESSGHGKTAGRGNKGARSRSGYRRSPVTSGIPWYRKLPMRGFSNANFRSARPVEVTLRQLAKTFEANATVDLVAMQKNGLVSSDAKFVKIIGSQDLAMPLIVQAHAFSKGAREAILRAGGRVMVGNVAAESIRCAGVDDVPQAGAEMAVSSEESDA